MSLSKFIQQKIIVLLLLSSINQVAFAQEKKFRNISVEKGLSQSTGFTIIQDTLGFIWVGTQDGLNRYDGKDFKVYSPTKENKNSLQSYYVRSLFVDSKGELWVGGNQGISRYNYKTDSFTNYKIPRSLGEWSISSITADAKNQIWATSISGDLFILKPGAKQFESVPYNKLAHGIKKISYIGFWQGRILLGTDAGAFVMQEKDYLLQQIKLSVDKPVVNDIYVDKDFLWIGTEGSGLLRFNQVTKEVKLFIHSPNSNSLSDNNIRTIEKDYEGNIWLGTFGGLSILNPKKATFENYRHQIGQRYTIGQNSVRYIFRDKQNGMWMGTYYGGISYYHKDDIKFNSLKPNTGTLALNDEVISVIKQDKLGNFWIGSNDKGLNYWDVTKKNIRYYAHKEDNPNSLSSNNIKAIEFDDDGNVLIGTHNGGLNLLNPKTGNVKRYLNNPNNQNSIAGDLVYSILKDSKGRIWVGTRTGLDRFIPATQSFMHLFADRAGERLLSNDITFLFEDSKHRIWVGTTNGVAQFYADNLLFGNIKDDALKEEVINCIVEDSKKRIWIGTRGGLGLYDEVNHVFITFRDRKDFMKGTIYGILPDDENNLWISTNKGLMKFNPDTKFSQSFYENDGLQDNQFNEYSFCKARDGMMLFGGIKGLTYFYPSDVKQQSIPLGISFTGLEVFNKNITVDDPTGILDNHIDQVRGIEIPPEYRQFSVFVNSFNFISANRTHYYYKLDGFDKYWQRSEDFRISYSNLPSGNYTLLVKAEGPDGKAGLERKLNIAILPPWYNTGWFYLLMTVILVSASYFIYTFVRERIRTLHQLKLERVDKEKVNYINKIKTEFFTNVSHELRTPLTLILAPLEELVKSKSIDKPVQKKHELMLTNARRLYNLVDQLFEFRKTEVGTRRLKVSKNDLVGFVQEIYQSFRPLADKNNINYTYSSTEAVLEIYFDHDAMEKILFNLLSNAFKYTGPAQSVDVNLSRVKDNVIIKIIDTGIGISEIDLPKIFDRFYQVSGKEMNLGSGVGLAFTKSLVALHHGQINVESRPQKGSVFTVELPIDEAIYQDDLYLVSKSTEMPVISNVEEIPPSPSENVNSELSEMQGLKVLIVDDNEEIVSYLNEYFGKNFEVHTAFDGKMALSLLDNFQFDLIISDVMMPVLDGLHFCRKVKQNINTSHIPVILLTAKTETEQQIKGLEMGADDYVTKPFSITLLAAKINNLLRSRRRLKEYYLSNKEIVPENIAFNTIDEEFLKQASSIIEAHLSDSDFSVDKFSREIGMSRSNLYLKLKAITGESATDFLKRIRFNKAVELMKSKRYTIAQVAYMCGFNSPSYFSTAFKQHFGCMPTVYLSKTTEQRREND
ncbi:response regulator [Pedobacter sp. MC2016-05]|uniref:hybrid sensor histidine kinase/response regulator transcription factor n=1 Tax=Pedobacter sp. MC2016-05 TaxID=2994474 RepID=UPI0022450A80|nr:hybrid sensor histidine kinase/response regulator transcription factor [Pedobacter sp. MC2016-05]MCX2477000.1 response regulator [Pedobacter sp. MC2016-05]